MTGGEALERAFAEMRRTTASLADDRVELGVGWGVRSRSLRRVWTLNQVCVTGPASFDEIVAACETHQADLPYRHAVVEHEATGDALEATFAGAGWKVDHEVLMLLGDRPARAVDATIVSELSEDEAIGLMVSWGGEERPAAPRDEYDQIAEYNRLEGRLWNEVAYGVVEHGQPVAVTKMRLAGGVGWVEDVYTFPAARGKGYARTLVTHVVNLLRSAGAAPTFVVADDDDWPKHLYASIGFEPIGRAHIFHLDLAATT